MVALRTRATATLGSVAGDINNCRASRERDSAQIYDTLLNDFHCIYFWQLFFPLFSSRPQKGQQSASMRVSSKQLPFPLQICSARVERALGQPR